MLPDHKTEWKLLKLCPDVAARWASVRKRLFEKERHQLRILDGFRSFADQWAIYSRGREKTPSGKWRTVHPERVETWELPGESMHNYGLAVDCAFLGDDPFLANLPAEEADRIWSGYADGMKHEGFKWGGDYRGPRRDITHCELTFGLSLHTIQQVYSDHGIGALWEKCKTTQFCGRAFI